MNLLKQFERVDSSWKSGEKDLCSLLKIIEENISKKTPNNYIFPNEENVFRCLIENKLDDVLAIVVGQDPYHQFQLIEHTIIPQAMGLSFSVPKTVKIPPSLRNIYKELERSIDGFSAPTHGDLSEWSRKGVLLLNTSLTVEYDKPNSHAKTGWAEFTAEIISLLVDREKPLVFLSWGKNAHAITSIAENTHHKVYKTSHPSPLGVNKSGKDFIAFKESNCFSEANKFLHHSGLKTIDWTLS